MAKNKIALLIQYANAGNPNALATLKQLMANHPESKPFIRALLRVKE